LPDDYLGSGPIRPEDVEYVLRQVRHRVNTLQSVQRAQTELLRENVEATHTLTGRTYGYQDDPEGGAIGRLRSAQRRMAAQNWAIILLLISVLAGVIATLASHH
jgi:hypothetical protein